ncbi:MAG TPA: sensor histidine kinase [Gemmatimonadaceae bacterium]|jgi:signal transduction histidine kinase|nr:sensor histidine kinase [Gemmatimonadaceae bacterium]
MQHPNGGRPAALLAESLRQARVRLTALWLERINARIRLVPNRVLPTDALLDHVPLILEGIAGHLEDPAQLVTADAAVIVHARELGALRHEQGFDLFEILKEYEILTGILLEHLSVAADVLPEPCERGELLECAQRVFHAVTLVQEATVAEYMQLLQAKLSEREERLRHFNRTLTHEFRNRIGAARGAAQLLLMPGISETKVPELCHVVDRSIGEMQALLDNLLELSRVKGDARQQRHVRLPEAAREVARELRAMAESAGVRVSLSPDLPDCEVPAAAVELCLTNLIANAIKYADPTKRERRVEIGGYFITGDDRMEREVVIEVSDNGIGVPEDQRDRLFQRFFRVRDERVHGIDGTGLGLSIVRQTIEELGGRVWAAFPAERTVFAFSLPCRRDAERREEDRQKTEEAELPRIESA